MKGGYEMFEPQFKFIELSQPGCVLAPSCDIWWAAHSECKCRHGCINPHWSQTSSN